MADTYAVVQKRGAPAGTGAGARGRGSEEGPLYSQVTPRARLLQAQAVNARGVLPSGGESRAGRGARRTTGTLLRLLQTQSCWGREGPGGLETPAPESGLIWA